jgi:hypothetical protein
MAKPTDDMGLNLAGRPPAVIVTFRLLGPDAAKLDQLAKRVKVGRSRMARLIVEKFIGEHDPEKKGKR